MPAAHLAGKKLFTLGDCKGPNWNLPSLASPPAEFSIGEASLFCALKICQNQ